MKRYLVSLGFALAVCASPGLRAETTKIAANADATAVGEKIDWLVLSGGGDRQTSTTLILNTTLGQTATGTVASLNKRVKQGYWQDFVPSCCIGRVGDANAQGDYPDEITLGDIMLMVDVLFISNDCSKFTCPDEADVNQSGGLNPPQESCLDYVSLADIMTLVDFLFITGPQTAILPDCL